jgi:hypothetical protein
MNALKNAIESQDTRMSPDTPTSAIPYPRWRILGLVVVHIVVGLMAACAAYSDGADVRRSHWVGAFFGLVVSQTSLLGVWIGLGMSPWWKKLMGLVIGVSFLFLLMGIGIDDRGSVTFAFIVMATSFVAIPLSILRPFRVAIHLNSVPAAPTSHIQFSIRHLMIWTSVIACLISIGKLVWRGNSDVLLMAFTYGVIGVVPVLFVLGSKCRVAFSISLVAVGACAAYYKGAWAAYYIGRRLRPVDNVFMTAAAMEVIAVVVSLLVVRRCGYRLVRLPSQHEASTPAGGAVVHSDPVGSNHSGHKRLGRISGD